MAAAGTACGWNHAGWTCACPGFRPTRFNRHHSHPGLHCCLGCRHDVSWHRFPELNQAKIDALPPGVGAMIASFIGPELSHGAYEAVHGQRMVLNRALMKRCRHAQSFHEAIRDQEATLAQIAIEARPEITNLDTIRALTAPWAEDEDDENDEEEDSEEEDN